MSDILHEHWELKCRCCGSWLCEGTLDGEAEWESDPSTPVVQAGSRSYAKTLREAHEPGCDADVVFVHVVRRKRGVARVAVLDEVRDLFNATINDPAEHEDPIVAFSDGLERLAKEASRGH
jgi:hypothetical protein